MPRRRPPITQADIARAIRAAEQAGIDYHLEINVQAGVIHIRKATPGAAPRRPFDIPLAPNTDILL
jgi:hypothetical protein